MNIYIYVCMHVCMYVCMYIYIYTYIRTYIHVYTHIHTYDKILLYMYACRYPRKIKTHFETMHICKDENNAVWVRTSPDQTYCLSCSLSPDQTYCLSCSLSPCNLCTRHNVLAAVRVHISMHQARWLSCFFRFVACSRAACILNLRRISKL